MIKTLTHRGPVSLSRLDIAQGGLASVMGPLHVPPYANAPRKRKIDLEMPVTPWPVVQNINPPLLYQKNPRVVPEKTQFVPKNPQKCTKNPPTGILTPPPPGIDPIKIPHAPTKPPFVPKKPRACPLMLHLCILPPPTLCSHCHNSISSFFSSPKHAFIHRSFLCSPPLVSQPPRFPKQTKRCPKPRLKPHPRPHAPTTSGNLHPAQSDIPKPNGNSSPAPTAYHPHSPATRIERAM